MHFAKVSICTFLKSVYKDGLFYTPFELFKEKSFHFLEVTINLFRNLKGKKNGRNCWISKNIFFIKRSKIFIVLLKCYATHRNYEILSISLVPTVYVWQWNKFPLWGGNIKLLRIQGIDFNESIPPAMYPGGPVRQPYSYSVPSPHRLFLNSSTGVPDKSKRDEDNCAIACAIKYTLKRDTVRNSFVRI
jgi:hypothetical protein